MGTGRCDFGIGEQEQAHSLSQFEADAAFAKLTGRKCKDADVDALEPEQNLRQRVTQYTAIRSKSQQYEYWHCSKASSAVYCSVTIGFISSITGSLSFNDTSISVSFLFK